MKPHSGSMWPEAAQWSLQLGQAGRVVIGFAALALLLAAFLYAFDFARPAIRKLRCALYVSGMVSFFVAFAMLATLILTRQYHFKYVFSHSDNGMPDDMYRFASLWGGQEGSFLLWACTSAIFCLLVAPRTGEYRRWFSVVTALGLAALAGILSYETPFALVSMKDLLGLESAKLLTPPDGAGLTPALLNWWMKIHPPTIFMGFGSTLALFGWSMAALIKGDLETWLKQVRPLAIVSTTLMGIGLIMGGFWAYETLGWGGFWMWDPVENASMVPWLFTAAFLHLIFVALARGKWLVSTAVFGCLGYIGFGYGTFLTRSGFLGDTSVHSFAEMDRQALWLLTGLKAVALLSVIVAATVRTRIRIKQGFAERPFEAFNKWTLSAAYGTGVVLLSAIAIGCAIGMSVPLIMSLRGLQPALVEEPLYNRVMAYLFIPLTLLMALGPYLGWRGLDAKKIGARLFNVVCISLGFLGIGMFMVRTIPAGMGLPPGTRTNFGWATVPTEPWVMFLGFICVIGIVANLYRIAETWKTSRSSMGAFLTHIGVITTMLGLIISRGLQRKEQFDVQQGRPGVAMGYAVTLEGLRSTFLTRENRMMFRFQGRSENFLAEPILFYTDRGQEEPSPTVRPWIQHHPLHDKYVTVYPMVYEATEDFTLEVGQTKRLENTLITYEKLTREGTPGTAGASFGALLKIDDPETGNQTINPKLRLTGDGPPAPIRAQMGDQYFVELKRMDAATQTVTLQLQYVHPIFPMELYFKPMPGLVWWGAGIMTFGGFLAAWQRRKQVRAVEKARTEPNPTPEPEPTEPNATAATA